MEPICQPLGKVGLHSGSELTVEMKVHMYTRAARESTVRTLRIDLPNALFNLSLL